MTSQLPEFGGCQSDHLETDGTTDLPPGIPVPARDPPRLAGVLELLSESTQSPHSHNRLQWFAQVSAREPVARERPRSHSSDIGQWLPAVLRKVRLMTGLVGLAGSRPNAALEVLPQTLARTSNRSES